MAFRNIPPDLVLPPGAPLTPGSGTIYIGSAQLPAALSSFESAIVFFSDAIGLSQGVDFWYLAHFGASHAPFTADGVQVGYYPTGGPLTKSTMGTFFNGGNDNVTIEGNTNGTLAIVQNSTGQLLLKTTVGGLISILSNGQHVQHSTGAMFLTSDAAANGAIQFVAPNGNFLFEGASGGGGPNLQIIGWQNGNAYIKSQNSNQDKWISWSTTATVLGVSWTILVDYRVSADYIIDVRVLMNNTPGCAAGNASFPMPPGVAAVIDASPTMSAGVRAGYGSLLTYPPLTTLASRLSVVTPGTVCQLDTWNCPAGVTQLEGSFIMTGLKP